MFDGRGALVGQDGEDAGGGVAKGREEGVLEEVEVHPVEPVQLARRGGVRKEVDPPKEMPKNCLTKCLLPISTNFGYLTLIRAALGSWQFPTALCPAPSSFSWAGSRPAKIYRIVHISYFLVYEMIIANYK